MKKLQVKDIVKICNGKLLKGDNSLICNNFSKDTRSINKGDIYIAIKGPNYDGNAFIEEAIKKGASACIIDNKKYFKKDMKSSIIYVKNTIEALEKIAKYIIDNSQVKVIAVTGSVGKTTTKELISGIVEEKYKDKILKSQGNYNNEIGVPLTILRLTNEKIIVLELAMNKLGEISKLSNIVKPDIAVITNIGTSHIGNLGSKRNILKAKLEIIDGLKDDGVIILNNDNLLLSKQIKQLKKKYNVITTGIERYSDYNANDITKNNFTINASKKIKLKLINNAYIYNVLNAYVVGKVLKMKDEKIIKGIENSKLENSRLSKIKLKNDITIIDDTYNSSYESVKESITYLNNITEGNKIIVLGDILELGKYSRKIHKDIGKLLLKSKINTNNIVLIGNDIKYSKIKNSNYFKTKEEGIKYLKTIIKPNDTILIKASNSMNFKEIIVKINKKTEE